MRLLVGLLLSVVIAEEQFNMWGKILFSLLMGFGVVIALNAKQNSLAIFFLLVGAVMIWLIRGESRRKRNSTVGGR